MNKELNLNQLVLKRGKFVKATLFSFIGWIVLMILISVIKTYVTDLSDLLGYIIGFVACVPTLLLTYKLLMIEDRISKIKPIREYLPIQEDEKIYKSFKKWFLVFFVISVLSMGYIVVMMFIDDITGAEHVLYGSWSNLAVMVITTLSLLGTGTALFYAQELRKEYIKIKSNENKL